MTSRIKLDEQAELHMQADSRQIVRPIILEPHDQSSVYIILPWKHCSFRCMSIGAHFLHSLMAASILDLPH